MMCGQGLMESPGRLITRILLAVSESSRQGYPHPSVTTRSAFDWIVQKILHSNTTRFKLFFLHVQPRDDWYREAERNKNNSRAAQLLGYFLTRCGEIGVQCEGLNRKGNTKKVICSEVGRIKPDILVVGNSRPPAGLCDYLRRLFVGDVGAYCKKYAECQVVNIVPIADDHHEDPDQAPAADDYIHHED